MKLFVDNNIYESVNIDFELAEVSPGKLKKPRAKASSVAKASSAIERLQARLKENGFGGSGSRNRRRVKKRLTKSKKPEEILDLSGDNETQLPSAEGIKSFRTCENSDQVADLLKSQTQSLVDKAFKAIKDGRLSEKIHGELSEQLSRFAFCGDTNQIDSRLLEMAFRQFHQHLSNFLKIRLLPLLPSLTVNIRHPILRRSWI